MALYTGLPVYLETYRLLIDYVQMCSKMSRDYRYTLGEQVKQSIMDIILSIYHANEATDKKNDIATARDNLVKVQLILRVLNDTKQIGDRQFAILTEHTVSVSKQLTGWAKSAECSK